MAESGKEFELVETSRAMELVPERELQAWWLIAGGLAVLLLVGLMMYLRKRERERVADPLGEKRAAYVEAKKELGEIESIGGREERGMAVAVSEILRRYLARAMQEPALYETHEEFLGRHEALAGLPEGVREETGGYFSRLADMKYGRESGAGGGGEEIVARGRELLERMHTG